MRNDDLFHALSDATRRQILAQLIERGECCVCHLYESLAMAQPKVSRHLAVLREAGLVQTRRAGLWVHYSLNPQLPDWARTVLEGMAQGQVRASIKPATNRIGVPSDIRPRRKSNAC